MHWKNERGSSLSLLELLTYGACLFFVTIVLFSVLEVKPDEDFTFTKEKTIYIKSFKNRGAGEVSIYLGTDSAEGKLTYFYMIEKEGGLAAESMSSKNVILYEEKNLKKPRIDYYVGRYKKEGFLGALFQFSGETKEKYKIYVPAGSIESGNKPI